MRIIAKKKISLAITLISYVRVLMMMMISIAIIHDVNI